MSSKYASLLTKKYQSVFDSQDDVDHWIWEWVYPMIIKEIFKGKSETKTSLDVPKRVIDAIRDKGYTVIISETGTTISWKDHAG